MYVSFEPLFCTKLYFFVNKTVKNSYPQSSLYSIGARSIRSQLAAREKSLKLES